MEVHDRVRLYVCAQVRKCCALKIMCVCLRDSSCEYVCVCAQLRMCVCAQVRVFVC